MDNTNRKPLEEILNKLTVSQYKAVNMLARNVSHEDIKTETGLNDSDIVFLISDPDIKQLVDSTKNGFGDKELRKTIFAQISKRVGDSMLEDVMDPERLAKITLKEKLEVFKQCSSLLQMEEKEDSSNKTDVVAQIQLRMKNQRAQGLFGPPKPQIGKNDDTIDVEFEVMDNGDK